MVPLENGGILTMARNVGVAGQPGAGTPRAVPRFTKEQGTALLDAAMRVSVGAALGTAFGIVAAFVVPIGAAITTATPVGCAVAGGVLGWLNRRKQGSV